MVRAKDPDVFSVGVTIQTINAVRHLQCRTIDKSGLKPQQKEIKYCIVFYDGSDSFGIVVHFSDTQKGSFLYTAVGGDAQRRRCGLESSFALMLGFSGMPTTAKNFGSKVKVARKYHAKKDNTLVDTFKKTSLQPAKKR